MRLDAPIELSPARAWRTYVGGSALDRLHNEPDNGDTNFPEEWIMSTVQARNAGREALTEGLSTIMGDSVTLSELIQQHPIPLLGEAHYRSHGAQLGVLLKLIDAGERLTIQSHPTKEIARLLFDSEYGKTECWHILGGRSIGADEPCIYFGFKPGITREYWKDCFDRQDIPAMLASLHRFPVKAGDTYLIRGGIPHAIGAGCFLVEIQEPTDYTVRVERTTPSGLHVNDSLCHQGLGFERMFDCFTYGGADAETTAMEARIAARQLFKGSGATVAELVGYVETPCFKMNKLSISGSLDIGQYDSFYGLYVLAGSGVLRSADGTSELSAGSQFFVPQSCAGFTLKCTGSEPLCLIQAFGPK